MQAFLIAVQFLTRVPVAPKDEWQEQQIAQSVLFYPLVGLLIGLALWLLATLLSAIEPVLSAALLLMVWVLITGGLHLDGLADSADAWAGGYGDKERSLQIMKDPAAGPSAVMVLVLLLLIKFSALIVILKLQQPFFLLVVPVLGRMSVIALFITTPYVREQGLGSAMRTHFNHRYARWILLACCFVIFILLPLAEFFIVMLASVSLLYFLRRLMMRRIDGMTGDTIGASIELVEAVSLVVFALMI